MARFCFLGELGCGYRSGFHERLLEAYPMSYRVKAKIDLGLAKAQPIGRVVAPLGQCI